MLARLLASCLLSLAIAGTAGAASVRPLLLAQIIDDSAIVFQGICTGNRTEREAGTNFVVTYTTFSVKEVLKGSVPGTYTIKQIGGVLPDGFVYRVDGVPSFSVGEEYVLLMPNASSAGFSSPIGLGQGRFSVLNDAAAPRVTNGRDFHEMTRGMPAAVLQHMTQALAKTSAEVRAIDLDDFKQLVRAHAARPH